MFIDDTGNVHSTASNHPQTRYAGIVGVIMNLDYLHTRFETSFSTLKERHFGLLADGSTPVLHLRKMKKAMEPFGCLKEVEHREAWQRACFRMYELAQYTVITVCVDKVQFYARHPNWTGSIYKMLVGNAIERFFYFLKNNNSTGDVMTEATNSNLDNHLKELYTSFYIAGTEHIPARSLQPRLSSSEIKIKPKSANIAGLQLADLLAATCFSHCKRLYADGPAFDGYAMQVADLMEQEKFYRDDNGNPHRYGRIWRP